MRTLCRVSPAGMRPCGGQQMTTVLQRIPFRRCDVMHLQRIALLAVALLVCLAQAKTAVSPLSGVVSIADGGPFTIIRQSAICAGTKGVTLLAGDIIETGPGAFLAIGLTGGSLLAIGPSSQVYILQRADIPTLIVLRGWVKADVRGSAGVGAIRVIGTRLGIQGQHAVVLIHADDGLDAIFDEQGSATLLLRDDAATRTDRLTHQNQFFVREDHEAVAIQQRPSADFVARMPIEFRDPLPEQAAAPLQKPAEAKRVRDVTYADIQSWLTMPRDWRSGFTTRFRGRLKDPAFFAAMDAHLTQLPEWVLILHPPPPPEEELPPGAQRRAEATPH
jgi:hypothetical protein